MKGIIFVMVVFMAIFQEFNSHFFNLSGFLQPAMKPSTNYFSRTTYMHDRKGNPSLFQKNIQGKAESDQRTVFNRYSGQYSTNLFSLFGFNGFKNSQRPQGPQEIAKDLQEAIGIPQDVITTKVILIHSEAQKDLYAYIPYRRIRPFQLYQSISQLKRLIQWIQQTYLKHINTIVLSDDNSINRNKIYVKGNKNKIQGQQNFVLGSNQAKKVLKGDNIVRIADFDIDLDEIQKIKYLPQLAISYNNR